LNFELGTVLHSGADFGTLWKKQKTYGRFLGTIFLEGFICRLSLRRNGLQGQEPQKVEKPRKKG
jgi:hypothetical protein